MSERGKGKEKIQHAVRSVHLKHGSTGFWDTGGILHMKQRSRAPVVTLQQSWAWPHPKAALQRRAQWQAGLLHSLPAHTAPAEGRPEPT